MPLGLHSSFSPSLLSEIQRPSLQNDNLTHRFVWVCNFVSCIEGRKLAADIRECGAEKHV
jgi:hypothetical protein